MGMMEVVVEHVTEEAQLAMSCACGSCHPTATVYRGDPHNERHDARLANGPCCCGRFFVVAEDAAAARSRAEGLAQELQQEGKAPKGHAFSAQTVVLPWGGSAAVVTADLRA